jgi:hypothetical protein
MSTIDDREMLERRIDVLDGLLAAPAGPLGSSGGAVGRRLIATWQAERRLLARLLEESQGASPRDTVEAWRARTETFVSGASDDAPRWTDRTGQTWDARQVLAILADLSERMDGWAHADEVPCDEEGEA